MTATWTTKAGETIPIRELKDSHLLNTIRMLRRNYRATMLQNALICDCAYPDGEPEGAFDAAQSEARYGYREADDQEDIERHIPAIKHLLAELARRKLEELPI